MFFFFFFPDGAVAAFKSALTAEKLTYGKFCRKAGVSRGALNKFVAGRALTPELLQKLLRAFPGEAGRKILGGHLRDEIARSGVDAQSFLFTERKSGFVFETLERLVAVDQRRLGELVQLAQKWEAEGTNEESLSSKPMTGGRKSGGSHRSGAAERREV
jgi:transcriptional regulator with XRE-family HTH domain